MMITDIHAALDALHTAHRNKTPAREERAADQRVIEAKRAAVEAFAALNGWRKAKSPHFDLDLLGKGANCNWTNSHDRQLLDHPIWFCSGRRFIAAVGQPYPPAAGDLDRWLDRLADRGLVLHAPADPLVSIHFPGSTLFVVVTKPGADVRFLPEQGAGWRTYGSAPRSVLREGESQWDRIRGARS
jgi:hypothetical protein